MKFVETVPMSLDELERDHILSTLKHFEYDRTRTANALGISVKTLYRKLHQYHDDGHIKDWRMPRSAENRSVETA